mgnify:CR=1 FL=1
MAFYRICPDCGAYLDPGEQCSCHEECLIEMERKEKATAFVEKMMKEEKNGQLIGTGLLSIAFRIRSAA